jgi:hypothetical protein
MKVRKPVMAAAALLFTVGANGATIYASTPVVTEANFAIPNLLHVAAGFTLSSGDTVRSITWQGAYGSGDPPPVTDSFTVVFYADSAGAVGSILGSFALGGPLSRIDTGLDASGDGDVYEFVSNLGPGMSLAAGSYWIEIKAAPSTPQWYWGHSGANSATAFDTGSGFVSSNTSTMYFVLDNATTVPIPAAAWLFGGALGLLGVLGE